MYKTWRLSYRRVSNHGDFTIFVYRITVMSPYPCFNTRLFWHKFSILQYIRVSYHGYFTRSVYKNTANQIFPWFIHGDLSWSLYWNTEIFQQFWQSSWFIHGNFFKIRDPKHADSIKVVSCICTISVVHTRKFFQKGTSPCFWTRLWYHIRVSTHGCGVTGA